MQNLLRRVLVRLYHTLSATQDEAATVVFKRDVAATGNNISIRSPFYLRGGQYVTIGNNFSAGPSLRLEAWDKYSEIQYKPQIIIGDHVSMNYDVHIGAIDRIVIGDNVLIGSRVLITDHSHGDLTEKMLKQHPVNCSLFSKGPVIVEDDVWIGEGVCILPGVRIGKHAIIGANAVVTRDVPPNSVVGGIPAAVLFYLFDRPEGDGKL